jgi:hypothetical protein
MWSRPAGRAPVHRCWVHGRGIVRTGARSGSRFDGQTTCSYPPYGAGPRPSLWSASFSLTLPGWKCSPLTCRFEAHDGSIVPSGDGG